jgi:hypothetical protein
VRLLRSHLRRYWVRLGGPHEGLPTGDLGMGVTAVDAADARSLLRASGLFAGRPFPPIVEIIEHVDVRDLDEGQVLPNIGDPSIRGVWFPRP